MRPDSAFLLRSRILRATVALVFGILLVNLFGMMVVRHREYQEDALQNRQVRFRVKAPRGRISDRDGVILADNKYIADIVVRPSALADGLPDSTLHRLLTWLDLPYQETLARMGEQKARGARDLVVVANAGMPAIILVEERERLLPGVRVETRWRRRYLQGPLFAHVIGYVGEVSQTDIDSAAVAETYRLGDMLGKQGVESRFEHRLRGRPGIKLEEVNASGRIVGRQPLWLQRVEPGSDVALTLSLPLQQQMADLLEGRVGCGIAVSVPGGEVLAAFSAPSFDPNRLALSLTRDEWNGLVGDPAKPFFNRIVQATYPPGSIYKPVTSLAGIAAGVVETSSVLEPCLGGYRFGNRTFRCWKRGGHGYLDHRGALVHSCDVFYYQVGLKLRLEQLAEAAAHFGLGARCSDLFQEEATGNIPTSAWYDSRFGVNKWTRGVLLNNSIGQGEILVTPLQMAMFTARLAVGDRVHEASFVRREAPRPTVSPLPYSGAEMSWIRDSLRAVVDAGTGAAARRAGLPVAGKTGTAQNSHGEDHAWFICYAPADDPEVAVAIILENAGHGGTEAAPLAGLWLHAFFAGRLPEDAAAMDDGTTAGAERSGEAPG
ncbi:MAG: penicillin-binding protein 2 [Candidatus Krumholzibacteriia bacterium]